MLVDLYALFMHLKSSFLLEPVCLIELKHPCSEKILVMRLNPCHLRLKQIILSLFVISLGGTSEIKTFSCRFKREACLLKSLLRSEIPLSCSLSLIVGQLNLFLKICLPLLESKLSIEFLKP